eukprot:m.650415 g.650415  ORF g.650415 m.650415 type:complete len:171 (-) comp58395_c0_seq20:882-1394(-)
MASGVCLVLCMLLAVGAAITAEEYEYLIRYEMARIRTMQELVQAANQSTYVKRTPIYPLFNPPPFQEVPREQPTAATIWGIPVVYLPAKHTPKGIVYLFYGGLLQPSSWFGDVNKDFLSSFYRSVLCPLSPSRSLMYQVLLLSFVAAGFIDGASARAWIPSDRCCIYEHQ